MSRTKGTPNRHPSFYGKDRLKKKAAKLSEDLKKFIDHSLTNQNFSNVVDFDSLNKTIENLDFTVKAEL